MRYFAVVDMVDRRDEGAGYGVHFPDLPGCTSAGDTVQRAIERAEEALQIYIDDIIERGAELPPASSADRLSANIEELKAIEGFGLAAIAAVPVRLPTKTERVNVTMDGALLEAVDRRAASRGTNRSAALAEAARGWLLRTQESSEG